MMGFFAGELAQILQNHMPHPQGSPWTILTRLGVHPQQINRVKKATEDIFQMATLPEAHLLQMRTELSLSPIEIAWLEAGIEGDVFLRMMLHHEYAHDAAANYANALFSGGLRDRLVSMHQSLHQTELASILTAFAAGHPRRGRGIRRRIEPVEHSE